MSNKKFSGNISGKGYYIALVLCAVAIGITGFLYYRNANHREPALQDPVNSVNQVGATENNDVEVVATGPDTQAQQETTPPVTADNKPANRKSPLDGKTVSQFSMDALTYNQTTRDWRVHDGMDISAQAGTKVCAAADGTVYTVYEDETMGTTVVINHVNGYTTKYASLASEVAVKVGDTVTAGQVIGSVGVSALLESGLGEHVHFAVSCEGKPVNPVEFLS